MRSIALSCAAGSLFAGAWGEDSEDELFALCYPEARLMVLERQNAGWTEPVTERYYKNRSLQGAPVTRRSGGIDYDWGNDAPIRGVGPDNFSLRFTGSFRVPRNGEWGLVTETDDGVRLWIDGKQIIDDWRDHAPKQNEAKLQLQAGRTYKLRMDYYERGGGAVARLFWRTPEGQLAKLPRAGDPGVTVAASIDREPVAGAVWKRDARRGNTVLAVAHLQYPGHVALYQKTEDGGIRIKERLNIARDPVALTSGELHAAPGQELAILSETDRAVRVLGADGELLAEISADDLGLYDSQRLSGLAALPARGGIARLALLVTESGGASLRFIINRDGNFQIDRTAEATGALELPARAASANVLIAADRQGDGRFELIIQATDAAWRLQPQGSGWSAPEPIALPEGAAGLAAGDFDDRRGMDLAVGLGYAQAVGIME